MRLISTCLIISVFYTGIALAQPFAYIANRDSNDVSVIDILTNIVIATVDVKRGLKSGNPEGVEVSPDGEFVYVTNFVGGYVSVIQTSDNTVLTTVDVDGEPSGLAVTPSGDFVYVASFLRGSVSVIQTSDNTVVANVHVGGQAFAVAMTPDGNFAYVTNIISNKVSVIRTSDNTVVDTVDIVGETTGVAVTPNGDFVYVANETFNNIFVIQTSDNTVLGTVDVGDTPTGVAVTPDGNFVYVTNAVSNNVSVIQTSDNTVVDTVNVGDAPFGVAVTPDGHFVYVANSGSNNVSVIQTSDNTVVDVVLVGSAPSTLGLFITPNGQDKLVDVNIDKASNIPNRIRRGRESTITYFISLESTGSETARDVLVTDMLPEGSVFEPDMSSENCEQLRGVPNTVECIVGDLASGETAFLDITISIVCEEDVLNQAIVEFLDSEGETRLKDSNVWTVRCRSGSSSSCSIAKNPPEVRGVAFTSIAMLLIPAFIIGARRLKRKRNKCTKKQGNFKL